MLISLFLYLFFVFTDVMFCWCSRESRAVQYEDGYFFLESECVIVEVINTLIVNLFFPFRLADSAAMPVVLCFYVFWYLCLQFAVPDRAWTDAIRLYLIMWESSLYANFNVSFTIGEQTRILSNLFKVSLFFCESYFWLAKPRRSAMGNMFEFRYYSR